MSGRVFYLPKNDLRTMRVINVEELPNDQLDFSSCRRVVIHEEGRE